MAAEAPERRRSVTGLVPAAAVAVTIAAVVFGGYAVGGALSRSAGPPVDVAGAARVQPLSGWEVAGRFDELPGVRLTRGGGNLDVIAVPFRGSAEDLLGRYVDRVLRPKAERLSISGTAEDVGLASGLPGARITYVGSFVRALTPIEGEITAVVSPSGVGVVFDAWGPTGVLRYIRGDARAMTDTAEVV